MICTKWGKKKKKNFQQKYYAQKNLVFRKQRGENREFITTRAALQEMLKGIPHLEVKRKITSIMKTCENINLTDSIDTQIRKKIVKLLITEHHQTTKINNKTGRKNKGYTKQPENNKNDRSKSLLI
jgi:hypothetical protein